MAVASKGFAGGASAGVDRKKNAFFARRVALRGVHALASAVAAFSSGFNSFPMARKVGCFLSM